MGKKRKEIAEKTGFAKSYISELVSKYSNSGIEAIAGNHYGGSQIYYVMHRHGWRKVMPRSKHPNKASDEAIEASKKLTKR